MPPVTLGKGQFGTVFAVREVTSGQQCVLKLYRRSAMEALDLAREKNFLNTAKRSGSPYIIHYVDDYVDERRGFYMIMAPVCRETMEQRVGRAMKAGGSGADDYNYRTLVKYMYQIAEGLMALHEMKIIHCDLALRNILLTYEDDIRLSDFGVACNAQAGGVSTLEAMKVVSVSLAPEMRSRTPRGRFGTKADCWSFGLCAYVMACKDTVIINNNRRLQRATPRLPGGWVETRTPMQVSE
jgi:serine/threonine protein kinase